MITIPPIADCVGSIPAYAPGIGILAAVDDLAAGLITILAEDRADRVDAIIEVEVLGLDVEEDGMFGMEIDEGPIAFVAFGHEPLPLFFPIRIRAENGNLRTDIMGGSLAPDPQDVGRKRGGRRLAMRTRDNDALFPEHDRRERLGPSEERDAPLHHLVVGSIARLDRARVDHDVGADDGLCGMGTGKPETRLLEALRLARGHLVRSRDVVPEA